MKFLFPVQHLRPREVKQLVQDPITSFIIQHSVREAEPLGGVCVSTCIFIFDNPACLSPKFILFSLYLTAPQRENRTEINFGVLLGF